jgi:hypothetical protein
MWALRAGGITAGIGLAFPAVAWAAAATGSPWLAIVAQGFALFGMVFTPLLLALGAILCLVGGAIVLRRRLGARTAP